MDKRVVIVTGASSGIGWAVARQAARAGWRVVAVARRTERLAALVWQIESAGGAAVAVVADLGTVGAPEAVISAALGAYGRIDALVNNAGMPLAAPFAEAEAADLRRQWDVNVTAVVVLTRLALPHLEATRGVVVNIGSALTRLAVPGMGNYSPNKIAVAAFTEALRREVGPRGVRVCLVEPGAVRSEFHARAGRGQMLPRPLVLSPAQVAGPLVRLLDRPRRRLVVPGWLAPALLGIEWAGRLVPPLADWLAARYARGGRPRA
jgi:short-subunit dehydrogenase